MEYRYLFLKYTAKAAVSCIPGGGLAMDLLTDFLPDIGFDVFEKWKKDRNAEERRADIEALVQAGNEEVREEVHRLVEEEAASLSEGEKEDLAVWLQQVPSSIRRTLRRPEDPGGQTVPSHLIPQSAEDVMRLLPERPPRFRAGETAPGLPDWTLERLLGAGGFGEVWLARNRYMGEAALKFCLDEAAARQLRNEAELLGRVRREGTHPGIVQLIGTSLGGETPCLQYEYVEGGELGGLIREWHARDGGPSADQAARVMLRIAEIVAFAHGLRPALVHRDLKPANILVERAEEGDTAFRITDFGIGGLAAQKLVQETMAGRTKPQEGLGNTLHGSHTPLYASPEQQLGKPPDPRDDVHALGVIWYQLLTGDMSKGSPRGRKWMRRLADERGVPEAHLTLLEECFEEEAEDRFSHAGELVEKLAGLQAVDSPPSRRQQSSGTPGPPPRRETAEPVVSASPSPRSPVVASVSSPFENHLGMRFVPVPIVGGPTDGQQVLFSIWQTRVQDYAAYAAANPGVNGEWKKVEYEGYRQEDDHPVVNVSWEDATSFCTWLTEQERAAGRIESDDRYRLPSDHEWSCAVGIGKRERAGRSPKSKDAKIKGYPWGKEWPPPEGAGNFGGEECKEFGFSTIEGYRDPYPFTAPVGSFRPSPDGLYDLAGNVWEWCEDTWDGTASGSRVLRGASWYGDVESDFRSSYRCNDYPDCRRDLSGFRCVLVCGGAR